MEREGSEGKGSKRGWSGITVKKRRKERTICTIHAVHTVHAISGDPNPIRAARRARRPPEHDDALLALAIFDGVAHEW